jgi:hypothetical protein
MRFGKVTLRRVSGLNSAGRWLFWGKVSCRAGQSVFLTVIKILLHTDGKVLPISGLFSG